jgi:hypothetical protein
MTNWSGAGTAGDLSTYAYPTAGHFGRFPSLPKCDPRTLLGLAVALPRLFNTSAHNPIELDGEVEGRLFEILAKSGERIFCPRAGRRL